jgi:hypothetical protein
LAVYSADKSKPATWGHMAVGQFLLIFALIIALSILDLAIFGILRTIGFIAWPVLEKV